MVENCVSQCSKYALCKQMQNRGLNNIAATQAPYSMAEFEDENGKLMSAEEFFGTTRCTPEQLEEIRQAGRALKEVGENAGALLLAGCTEGPFELFEGTWLCRSENKAVVIWTEEDLL